MLDDEAPQHIDGLRRLVTPCVMTFNGANVVSLSLGKAGVRALTEMLGHEIRGAVRRTRTHVVDVNEVTSGSMFALLSIAG